MTVLEVLQATTAYLKKHNVENSRLNAEHLMAHALGRKRIELYLDFERELTEAELGPLRELVKRRSEGDPLQHLLGTVEFCGLTFLCDKRAMVPRPETEQLVELVESRIENDDALALAQENAAMLNLNDRVQFLKSRLLENVEGAFDLIVANLPYVSTQGRHTLSREVLHDPKVALFAGKRGDELVRELIDQAPTRLHPGGLLALEIGLGQSETLLSALAEKNYRDICSKNDYNGVTRFIFARYG